MQEMSWRWASASVIESEGLKTCNLGFEWHLRAFLIWTAATLWRTLPALKELQTAWEDKQKLEHFFLYKDAIDAGLAKLQKYYSQIDAKPVFILALGMFLYFFSCSVLHTNIEPSSSPIL